jgi:S-adenosylmethionine decarboxylase
MREYHRPYLHMNYVTRDQFNSTKSWGLLTSIDLHACNPKTIRDEEKIKEFVYELCSKIEVQRFGDCHVVHFADHNEDVAGFSMVQLIETSLISGHFANKTNNVYLDIFSCKYYDPGLVIDYAVSFFEAANYTGHATLRK